MPTEYRLLIQNKDKDISATDFQLRHQYSNFSKVLHQFRIRYNELDSVSITPDNSPSHHTFASMSFKIVEIAT